ncbi:MAG TPA: hypothetical protein VF070_39425 [Streptosporangiaceae bacterium]
MDGIPAEAAAITAGFGAPRPTAVLAVLGYRIASYWLPPTPGMGGLSSPPAEPETGWDRKPAAEFRGRPEAQEQDERRGLTGPRVAVSSRRLSYTMSFHRHRHRDLYRFGRGGPGRRFLS